MFIQSNPSPYSVLDQDSSAKSRFSKSTIAKGIAATLCLTGLVMFAGNYQQLPKFMSLQQTAYSCQRVNGGQSQFPSYLNLYDKADFEIFETKFREIVDEIFVTPLHQLECLPCLGDISDMIAGVQNNQYLEKLTNQNETWYQAAFLPVDGTHEIVAQSNEYDFSIMSTGKVVGYAYALQLIQDEVHQYVGSSYSNVSYASNELTAESNAPYNPFNNNGAIMVAYLIVREGKTIYDVQDFFRLTAEDDNIHLDDTMYATYDDENDYNLATAMLTAGVFPGPRDWDDRSIFELVDDALVVYLEFCNFNVTAYQLAEFGRTLAKGGLTQDNRQVIHEKTVKSVIHLMSTSGLYSSTTDFLFDYGIATKSGVSGCILTIIPGVGAMATHNSLLDAAGNGFKSMLFIHQLHAVFDIDLFVYYTDRTHLYFDSGSLF